MPAAISCVWHHREAYVLEFGVRANTPIELQWWTMSSKPMLIERFAVEIFGLIVSLLGH